MQPQFHPQIAAIGLAVLASFFIGFLWYGPLFGKTWARLMGFNTDKKPEPKTMIRAMLINLFGTFLMVYVMSMSTQVWRGTVWGANTPDMPDQVYGFFAGFFTWLGYYIPIYLNTIAWENRPFKLFAINAVHGFIQLQAVAMILAFMY